jgi:hypothetical protein
MLAIMMLIIFSASCKEIDADTKGSAEQAAGYSMSVEPREVTDGEVSVSILNEIERSDLRTWELRLYYDNSTKGNGCSVTLTTDGTIKITGVELTASSTSYTPTVKYYVDNGAAVTGTWSSTKMTISGIEAAETFKFQNANTENKQLRIKSIKVTYEPVADAVDTAIPPTFTNGGNFVGSTMVEIKNNDENATVYVSVDGGEYVEYEKFEIEETTTVSPTAKSGSKDAYSYSTLVLVPLRNLTLTTLKSPVTTIVLFSSFSFSDVLVRLEKLKYK